MTDLTLPGLIDIHTHLRVPGGEHKEDFATGTAAALAGGVTLVLAMPNTNPPLTTPAALETARHAAARDARCDVGLYAGAAPGDLGYLPQLAEGAVALKIYLNDTFGKLRMEDVPALVTCFRDWPRPKLIALHAERQSVAVALALASIYDRPIHIVHVSRREEIELIADAKGRGLPVTCEVSPHHLFLTVADAARLGPLGDMRPLLGTADDVAALWAHLNDTIDCIATDHAPHTLAEKGGDNPPPGVPGLETSLPLMLAAVQDGRLSVARLTALMHDNPRRIFGLPPQPDTRVEVDMTPWVIPATGWRTKCDWTPFAGLTAGGRVARVVMRGQTVYEAGVVLAAPGTGQLL
ncbi:Dihydroorotase [Candidatus Promineifilum breve]|uniref:Dihydroorotase n=1 Tax=Candidatus Promineifilum breve TaxID=1806508 RepID=A0A160T6Z2_9CHLR|nr:amidohydrolase family protein [Candidatus Promineifilum breve]CUS05712.1 Dihydroorotase [Candidatus Promineifilum breve]